MRFILHITCNKTHIYTLLEVCRVSHSWNLAISVVFSRTAEWSQGPDEGSITRGVASKFGVPGGWHSQFHAEDPRVWSDLWTLFLSVALCSVHVNWYTLLYVRGRTVISMLKVLSARLQNLFRSGDQPHGIYLPLGETVPESYCRSWMWLMWT